MTLDVKFLPSFPARGESLTKNVIDIVGGSIGNECNGSVTSIEAIVSATVAFSSPAIAMISPACAVSIGILFNPSKASNFVNLAFSTSPSTPGLKAWTASFIFAVPLKIFPVRILPKYWSYSRRVTNILKSDPSSIVALGTCPIIVSRSGAISFFSSFSRSLTAHPLRPEA